MGFGFIVSNDGKIFINVYVVDGVDEVIVIFKDGCFFFGWVMGFDFFMDVVVVKIEVGDLFIVALGDFDYLQVGEWAIVIGNFLGLDNMVIIGILSVIGCCSVDIGVFDKWVEFI